MNNIQNTQPSIESRYEHLNGGINVLPIRKSHVIKHIPLFVGTSGILNGFAKDASQSYDRFIVKGVGETIASII